MIYRLGLAVLIGLLLPVTAHGDLFISAFNSTLIFTDHPNFYYALADEPTAVFPTGLSGGPYGPLFYYPTAAWLFILDKLHLVDISTWTSTDDANLRSIPTILLLKLPNLSVHLLVGLVLLKTFPGRMGRIASVLWLANPAVILFSLMMGQNDGWTVLALITATFFGLRAIEQKPLFVAGKAVPLRTLAMFALAAGAAIKLSPILLVLPFAWTLGRNIQERALLATAGFGAFAVLIGPFLGTAYFWDHGLFGTQTSQVPAIPLEVASILYVTCLALLFVASKQIKRREHTLLLAMLAIHALLFALPEWSPQRAVLFIGVLTLTAPSGRLFAVSYVLTTILALAMALEHENEIAIGLLEPLSARVALIPALVDESLLKPWLTLLYAVTGLAWAAALIAFWRRGYDALPPLRWQSAAFAASTATLLVYLGLSASLLPRGIDQTPYEIVAKTQTIEAGETMTLLFFAGRDDLRTITIWLDETSSASASVGVVSDEGDVLYSDDARELVPGRNRIHLGRIQEAAGAAFYVSVTPSEPIRMQMVDAPDNFVVAAAERDSVPLPNVPAYTLHHETTWGKVVGDSLSALREEWGTVAGSMALTVTAFLGLGLLNSPEPRGRPPL